MRGRSLLVAVIVAALVGAPANVSAHVVRARCVDGLLSGQGRLVHATATWTGWPMVSARSLFRASASSRARRRP